MEFHKMFNIKAILLLLIFIVLLLSCEHKKNNNILIPNKISVCKLVEYINSDTNNYKVIYIYNPYCKPCEDQFRFLIETSKQNENNRWVIAITPISFLLVSIFENGRYIFPRLLPRRSNLLQSQSGLTSPVKNG